MNPAHSTHGAPGHRHWNGMSPIAKIILAFAIALMTPTIAMADEASGYSVGTPVASSEETGYTHYYAYPSRDFTGINTSVEMREEDVEGMQVFILSKSFEGDMSGRNRILFLHGGAYVGQLNTEHVWFASNIAKATGAIVYLPAYPTAGNGRNYTTTYPPMEDLYRAISDPIPPEHFFVMGDSAGGGLAVGLCQTAAQMGMKQPRNMILLSPWADVTVQPWESLVGAATIWAGSDSAQQQKNWRVSPTYGDMRGLHHVTIYNGETDGLSKSIEMLYHQMRGNNVDCQLITARNMGHDYPYLLPRAEAIRTFNLICASVMGRLSPQDNDMEWIETVSASAFDNGRKNSAPSPKAISSSPLYEGKQ